MKRIREIIDVRFEDGQPVRFIRTMEDRRTGRMTCIVLDVLESWDVRGRWWATESTRRYIRVRTDRGTFELCGESTRHQDTRWMLTGVSD